MHCVDKLFSRFPNNDSVIKSLELIASAKEVTYEKILPGINWLMMGLK